MPVVEEVLHDVAARVVCRGVDEVGPAPGKEKLADARNVPQAPERAPTRDGQIEAARAVDAAVLAERDGDARSLVGEALRLDHTDEAVPACARHAARQALRAIADQVDAAKHPAAALPDAVVAGLAAHVRADGVEGAEPVRRGVEFEL